MIVFISEPNGGRSSSSMVARCAVAGITDEYVIVEVHQQDPDHNRCIIVIEAPDVTAEVDLFKAVSTLSGVADAALVVHNFEDDAVVCSSNT